MARVLTAVAGAAMARATLAQNYNMISVAKYSITTNNVLKLEPTQFSREKGGCFSKFLNRVPAVRSFSASQSLHQVADPVWNLGQLNHVAIAVPDLKKSTAFYQNILGAQVSEVVPLPEHGVSVVFVNLGNTKMELLHPLGNDSPIAGFLQKNKAGGMHHICIEVDNINAVMMDLKKKKIRILSEEVKIGAHGKPVIFLHPKDCGGVLIELEQA
ncbi:methylmalonyl-CoA epimerase mitochondrial [Marmota monax]|uniref:Methylmalonyl-CoA epimerase, mitochondrial n=2 Tax=Marmota monax TaxID=9995 RepID=A0A834QVY3_MARMO|nr:methylmalonyl-CoA epimerase mitochondrial [Marmota monax]